MLIEGEEICRLHRIVPGTMIELVFVLHYRGGKYEANVIAVREGQQFASQRTFNRMYKAEIQLWAGTLVNAINEAFGTRCRSILRQELERVMEIPEPSSAPAPQISPQPLIEAPIQDHISWKDVWEHDPADTLPRSDIITTLTLRRVKGGILCLLKVDFGNQSCELPSALGSIGAVHGWLGLYDTGKWIAIQLGLQDADALAMCRHWMNQFEKQMVAWQEDLAAPVPAWLRGKQPPPQTYIVDGQIAELP